MQYWPVRSVILALLLFGPTVAHAAGIDCTKARSPTEKAICNNPGLLTLDQQIATAYADTLAHQPERADALRQDLIRWLKQRDTDCALPSADIPQCLTRVLTARLAALAPPAAAPQPAPPAVAPPPAASSPIASSPIASSPVASPPAGMRQTAAPARPADPPIPAMTTPPGAAALDTANLPAAEHAETLLHVTRAGRFTIAAKSPSGAAIQLVDILTGPGDTAGVAGAQDGRLDLLLDEGTYKLRVASAASATGSVALTVTPFHDAAPPTALPPPGFPLNTTLRDGEQRAFWLAVPPDSPSGGVVRIEAAGRALADLHLWRDGRDLSALEPAAMVTEPTKGHPMTDLRLEGKVEPGTYLAVAYGGPPLSWMDNDAGQPFLLQAGTSPALAEGWAAGPMGPFGSEVYALSPAAGLLRLSLPEPAAAELRAGDAVASITHTSREPTVHLAVQPASAGSGRTPVVEVRAAAGQNFTLQALERPLPSGALRPGAWWVSAVANGAGGDEVPPGVLLERIEAPDKPPRIVANTLPRIGPATAWHTRFNLRGETTLLVQNTAGAELTVRASGVPIRQRGLAGVFDLPADYYGLDLVPGAGAAGSLDLIVGPPGAAAPPVTPLPPDPVIPLGVQTLAPGQSLRLLGPTAPGLQLGLSARRVPVALAEGPLTVTQAAGSTLAVPVTLAPGGTLAVSEVGGGPIAFGQQDTGSGAAPGVRADSVSSSVVIPLADHARSVVLAWRRSVVASPIPAPRPAGAVATLAVGEPANFDLAHDESRGFALTVPEGGLYRVETTGRLRTAGRIATAFIPRLRAAEANGVGQNMVLQPVLRAGSYRVDVTALQSAGHLGLSVTPAPMLDGAALLPGGSVRASLPAGSAIRFPLKVAGPGDQYRLDVASLGAPWQGRIEDAEGWPMTRTAPLDGMTPVLPPGTYRLVVSPPTVDRQVVARLTAVTKAPDIAGHGPHALPFEAPQAATWREPDGRDQPRTPDSWVFNLSGSAGVTLDLSDGMVGELRREGNPASLARIVGHYAGTLEAGQYRLDATSLGRNDRLSYTIALASPDLQPDVARSVAVPSSVGFAIATTRVVSLTSFGNTPVKAVLRSADGAVVARYGARRDDWNMAASRLLPAGRYTLDLAVAGPADLTGVQQGGPAANREDSPGSENEDTDNDDQKPQAQAPAANSPPDPDNAAPDDAETPAGPTTELRLTLPAALAPVPAPSAGTPLSGTGVHVLTLEPPPPNRLLLAQATSSASLVLALERQVAGTWQTVALNEGTAPVVASPTDDNPAAWRVEAWTVDGGAEPIQAAARVVDATARAAGVVAMEAVEGMPAPLAVARVGAGWAGACPGGGAAWFARRRLGRPGAYQGERAGLAASTRHLASQSGKRSAARP